jgi:hypothetical protein
MNAIGRRHCCWSLLLLLLLLLLLPLLRVALMRGRCRLEDSSVLTLSKIQCTCDTICAREGQGKRPTNQRAVTLVSWCTHAGAVSRS